MTHTQRYLPIYRELEFREYLTSIGVSDETVTAFHKIAWLQSIQEGPDARRWQSIYQYALGLAEIGPTDRKELARQAEIVRAFTLEMLVHNKPRAPRRAMPPAVFKQLILSGSVDTARPTERLSSRRNLAGLKLAWNTGLAPAELCKIRRGWLHRDLKDGAYILAFKGQTARRTRTLFIPANEDPDLCAVVELDRWLALLPTDPAAFIFPKMHRSYHLRYDAPMAGHAWGLVLKRLLRKVGQVGVYDFHSIQRTVFVRIRSERGPAAALAASGFYDARSLDWKLRREPDWSRVHVITTQRRARR